MTERDLSQIQKLFEAALECDPATRFRFLEQACSGDLELLGAVQQLLQAHAQTGGLLDQFALPPTAMAGLLPLSGTMEGRQLGPYRIGHEIGRGGMGIVYLASRADGAFHKQFALKIVQSSLVSKELVVRFRREREILGSLDHLHIARLIDAGVMDDELPYYVMEYIGGKPIDKYCDEHRLNTTQRIQLFRAVCQAVQYAHQNLIVHRDLKPSNILVTSEGTVKLLDFGIAKFLDEHQQETILAPTQTGMRLMTPEYASPEQIKGEPITTATDVYALGVILYELLTGRWPYQLKSGLLHEIERVVCEESPTRPSTVAGREEQTSSPSRTADELSALREGTRAKLKRRLAGDLDNIVLMALRKEPTRRYPSVEQLEADLRRHLEGLPVVAGKDTALYRAEKFLLRHKFPVIAAVTFLLFLLGALVTTVELYLSAKRAQDSAVQQAAEARARQLAAQAEYLYMRPYRFTLGALLGLESVRRVPLTENRSFLASALAFGERPYNPAAHPRSSWLVTISPEGRWLAHRGKVPRGRERARLELSDPILALDLSRDGRWLVTGGHDKTARLWDAQTGRERLRLEHQARVWSVAISPDSTGLATGSDDGVTRLWDIGTGRERFRWKCQGAVNAVAISPDGAWLAAAGNDKTAHLWDVRTGRERARLHHQDWVRALAVSPDGAWLATGGNDKIVHLWDARTGQERARLHHQDWVRAVAISHDGTWLASAGNDKTARLWNAQTGGEQARLELPDGVRAVAISPDDRWLATVSFDNVARLWDIHAKREYSYLQFKEGLEAVTFTKNGGLLVAHGSFLTLEPWRTADLIEDLCTRLDRNLTYEEWRQYLGNDPYRQTCPNLSR